MTATMSKALLANPPPDSFDEIKPGSLIGLISESHLCIDCGFDTAPVAWAESKLSWPLWIAVERAAARCTSPPKFLLGSGRATCRAIDLSIHRWHGAGFTLKQRVSTWSHCGSGSSSS
jgi:hypothetical protein